ncbi:MAG: DUF4124 domain-containing protein [Halioglobus sp.]
MKIHGRYVTARSLAGILGLLLLTGMSLLAVVARGEIYQWVDADGRVHFGDKPRDPAQARDVKPVELNESYRPAERSVEEQQQYDREQQSLRRRDDMRQRKQQAALDEAQEMRRQEKTRRCTAYQEHIDRLTSVEIKNGVRTIYYVEDEDGKSISSDRQREIIAGLRKKMADEGCP